jgi:hypothetical protein
MRHKQVLSRPRILDRYSTWSVLVLVLVASCLGCAESVGSARSVGSHAANYSFMAKSRKYIVWSNHYPGSEHASTVNAAITQYLQQNHQTVVERSKLDAVFREQRFRLMYTPDDQADLLRVGKLLGADQIIFTDCTSSYSYDGSLVTVRLRAVDVETAAILWSGSAWFTYGIRNEDEGLAFLASIAMYRALCPTEELGVRWTDYDTSGKGGCKKE